MIMTKNTSDNFDDFDTQVTPEELGADYEVWLDELDESLPPVQSPSPCDDAGEGDNLNKKKNKTDS